MKVIIDDVEYAPMPNMSTDKGLLAALDVRFDSDAGDNLTVRDYLYRLLEDLWAYGEGFNSKRPFGNSGWEYDLYAPLVRDGFIEGTVDEEGRLETVTDKDAAGSYVFELISAAFYGIKDESA